MFVPRGDGGRGDDGWIIAMGFDHHEQRSALRVLDASTLEFMCSLALPMTVAPGFHGSWLSAEDH